MVEICDVCKIKEAEFFGDDGVAYCVNCVIAEARRLKTEREELGNLDELEVMEVMKSEQVNRTEAIARLRARRGGGAG